MSSGLLLVFLQPDAICHLKVRVRMCAIDSVSEFCGLSLHLSSPVLVRLGFVKEGWGKVGEGGEVHFTEISCPLGRLLGFPVGRELLGPIYGGCECLVPVDFADVATRRVGQ